MCVYIYIYTHTYIGIGVSQFTPQKLNFYSIWKLGRGSFPGGSDGKESPSMQETQVQSLGLKDSLEKEMATHSSILAGKIQWMEETGRLQSLGSQRIKHN